MQTVKQILENQSFDVETASSVKEALKKVSKQSFDVIVSDYQMTKTTGLEFLKTLRASGNKTPFILFTGKSRKEVAVQALNLGVDRYFHKFGDPETVYCELAHGIRQVVAQKRVEQKIWDNEEQLRAIIAASPDIFIVCDINGYIMDCNLKALELFEVSSKEEVIGKHVLSLLGEDINQLYLDLLEPLLKNGCLDKLQTKLLKKSGSELFLEFSANLLKDASGNVVGGVAMARDITEYKQTEAALKLSEEKLRAIMSSANDAIILMDPKGNVSYWNDAAKRMFGYSKEEVIGNAVHDFIGPKHFQKDYQKEFNKFTKTGKGFHVGLTLEMSAVKKDGTEFPTEISVSAFMLDGKWYAVSIVRDITERKNVEKFLEHSEKRFRELSELLPEAIYETDANGVITYVNNEGYVCFGYTKQDFENGLTTIQMVAPEDREKAKKRLLQLSNGKRTELTEYTAIRKDGSTFPIIAASVPIMHNKKFVGTRGVMVDITERKKTEDKLRESEEKFRNLAEQSPNMIFINIDSSVVYINKKYTEVIGYTLKDLQSPDFDIHTAILPENLPLVKSHFAKQHNGETPSSFECTLITKKGTKIDAMISTSLIKYGGQTAVLGTITDITQQKKVTRALAESEKRFRELSELLPEIVYEADEKGVLTFVNKDALTRFGYTVQDFDEGFTVLETIAPEYRDVAKKNVEQLLHGKRSGTNEYVAIRKDGSTFPIIIDSVPIVRSNKVVGFRGVMVDITERKLAEKALEDSLETLKNVNEKLGVVGKLTRHDARNKLSLILNHVFLAKNQLDQKDKVIEHLDLVESAVELIEKIFDFSRLYEKLGKEELSNINVKEKFDEAAALLSCSDFASCINECEGLTVLADSLLRQLFYNLIDNSLMHGEKVTQIKVYYTEEKDKTKLIYEDNGVGIPETEKQKIFEEGYGKGTGYGLYLIEKMCEVYGWDIKETGEPDRGAQFTITIPKQV